MIGRISTYMFEAAAALVWLLVGMQYLINPESTATTSPIRHLIGLWAYVFSSMEIAAAPAIILGILHDKTNWRASGLMLLGTGVFLHGLIAVWKGIDLRDANYFIYAAACYLRLCFLYRLSRKAHLGVVSLY